MFNAAKTALSVATKLEHPQADSLLVLSFSKKLSLAVTRYSAFHRELLAVYSAIRHFCLMLEGCQFFVLTDHKLLCHALGRLSALVRPTAAAFGVHL